MAGGGDSPLPAIINNDYNSHFQNSESGRATSMSSSESLEHRELGLLYRDHHGWLRGWLLRRLSVPAEAADLAQDTFLRLLASPASLAQLQGVRQPRSFLATVAQRTLVDHIRRQVLERA